MRPTGIDLFAGAGGLSLGFEQAGFDIAAAVEIDPVHSAVHAFNFPETTILPRSVEGLSGADIRDAAGIGDRRIDCVFGGAPCQGFSLIGHRVLDDPRNALVRDFVRIVAELEAGSFVFENVRGLTVGKHRAVLDELVEAFEQAGYRVRLPWQVLNAAHYGVPQNRQRLFLMGVREGGTVPDYPAALTNIAGQSRQYDHLPDGPTVRQAIGDLPDADGFDALLTGDMVRAERYGRASAYAAEMRCTGNDAWHFGYVRDWQPGFLTSSARTVHTGISKRRFAETAPGTVEPISRFFRLPMEGVSNTLRAGTDGARGAFTSPRPIHYAHDRCITVREMARLHGFPDWFRFNATKWHGARQIGNAVPPPLARAVAGAIRDALGIRATRPERTLSPGDAELLHFDLSKASRHFGIAPPPSKRDRKSGAKKRKQVDIERERLNAQHGPAHG